MGKRFLGFMLLLAMSYTAIPQLAWADYDEIFANDARYQQLRAQFDEVIIYYNNCTTPVMVRKGDKMGIVDGENRVVVPVEYDAINSYGDELFVLHSGDMQGVADAAGRMLTPVKYRDVLVFDSEGRHYALLGEGEEPDLEHGEFYDYQMSMIDATGKVIIPAGYPYLYPMNQGQYDDADSPTLVIVIDRSTSKMGVFDLEGNLVLPIDYDAIFSSYPHDHIFVEQQGIYGVFNGRGEARMPMEFTDITYDHGGCMYAAARLVDGRQKYAFYDMDDKPITGEIFTEVMGTEPSEDVCYSAKLNGQQMFIGDYHEGLASFVPIDGDEDIDEDAPVAYGYLDTKGRVAIEPQYAVAGEFSCGRAMVVPDGDSMMYGYIDKQGKMVIPAEYGPSNGGAEGQFAPCGLAMVNQEATVMFIDVNGKSILMADYGDNFGIVEIGGVTYIAKGNKYDGYGLYDTKGKFVRKADISEIEWE